MKIVGHYRLISEIGQGSMGRVFLAEDMRDSRQVALKAMLGETNSLQEKRFLREVQAMSRLSHPNIIQIYEVNKENNRYYFTMPYIEGEMLSELIAMKRLTTSRIIEITTKIARAIHYAHENDLLHRDLKPSNIMVNKQGEPIVMDFGLAKQFRDTTKLSQTGEILGTPAYMSPEQARSNQKIDGQTDVYSLGICFYEMLTGRVPFSGTKWQILAQLIHKKPAPPRQLNPQIHETLELICLKAIEKQKHLRFATAEEFAEELQRFGEGKSSHIKKRFAASFIAWMGKYHLPVMGALLIFVTIVCFILFYERVSQNPNHGQQMYKITFSESGDLPSKKDSLTIHGKAKPGSSLHRIFVNGREYTLENQQQFTKEVPILYGKKTVEVITLSRDHRWSRFTCEITRHAPQNQAFIFGDMTNNRRVHSQNVRQLQPERKFELGRYESAGAAVVCEDILYFALRRGGLQAWKTNDGTELWTFSTNHEVRATPAVMNGRVYFSDYQKLYCLDMYSGVEQWHFEINSPSRSIMVDEETVFVGCRNGKFFAIAIDGGMLRWKKDVVPKDSKPHRGRRSPYDFRGNSALYKDMVIATCSNKMVYCWKKNTGREVWAFRSESGVRTAPVVVGRTIYFGSNSGRMYGIDVGNKQQKWQFKVRNGVETTPLIYKNTIYFGCEGGYVYAVDLQRLKLKWEQKVDSEIASPVIVGDRLYCGSKLGELYAFDLSNGNIVYQQKCVDEIDRAPFVYQNKMFVTGEEILKTFILK
ncbi:serine/threonine-protein kinase [Candidatus Uabimicrobium amorphum]|uniref:non-specific serine/threonine protein kinase n=1 Tax=Uabimicrobium amorphum TaxID=2596890 RepID=A0A5S9IP11_UABAM|nr:serine/threonine-protein kinase [Candidatus Uabimicrobium amorphum]BBM85409.1 protein kinase [Candidatus Uabimicrobium amorphum]